MFDYLSITDWYYNGDMIFEDMVITILLFKLYILYCFKCNLMHIIFFCPISLG